MNKWFQVLFLVPCVALYSIQVKTESVKSQEKTSPDYGTSQQSKKIISSTQDNPNSEMIEHISDRNKNMTNYTDNMEKLKEANPAHQQLQELLKKSEENRLLLKNDLEYNRRLRNHIKASARQIKEKLARAHDYLLRYEHHLSLAKINEVNKRKEEAMADRAALKARCEVVDHQNKYTSLHCREELAEIDVEINDFNQLILRYKTDINSDHQQ